MAELEHFAEEVLEEHPAPRDPEDRPVPQGDEHAHRERNFDKTLADSFPPSDPPSTIPDPAGDV